MKTKTFVLALVLAVPMFAGADNKNTDKTTDKAKADKKLTDADIDDSHVHHVNLMEVDMGKIAQTHGTAPVKRYGEMLVSDHRPPTRSSRSSRRSAASRRSRQKPATDAEKRDEGADGRDGGLKKLKGADFDREYLRMMVDGHDKELAMTIRSSRSRPTRTSTDPRGPQDDAERHSDGAAELRKGKS